MEPVVPPSLGRSSPAADAPVILREDGHCIDAAYRAEGGSTPSWELRAATVAGLRHRLAGQPGQDAFAWAVVAQHLVVAVADGVGSRAGASNASNAAVRAACALAASAIASEEVDPVGAALAGANRAVAGGEGATTLMVAVAGPGGAIEAGRVGDTTLLLFGASGDSAEMFASGADWEVPVVTAALPLAADALHSATERCRLALQAAEVVVLATDGVADPWRDGPTTVAPSLASVLRRRPGPLDLLVWADFARQGCHDDRTLVALWPAASLPG
ncbi:MAG: protein phosphatase 2C domain-containing protein [Acidimicrobiales bacterium]